jgi:hypothetical protein
MKVSPVVFAPSIAYHESIVTISKHVTVFPYDWRKQMLLFSVARQNVGNVNVVNVSNTIIF